MKTLLILMLAAKALTPDVCSYAGMFASGKIASGGTTELYVPAIDSPSLQELAAAHWRLRQALKHLPKDEPFRSCLRHWILNDLDSVESENATRKVRRPSLEESGKQQDDARVFLRNSGEKR
jgi:hypothetical protein